MIKRVTFGGNGLIYPTAAAGVVGQWGPGAKTPIGNWIAVAIAGDSILDQAVIDGVLCSPGHPVSLSGARRSLTVDNGRPNFSGSVRGAVVAPLTLLLIDSPCDLALIPRERSMASDDHRETIASGAGGSCFVQVQGRRHTTLGVQLSVAGTWDLIATRYSVKNGVLVSGAKTLVASRALSANVYDSYEIGGIDNEENWDEFQISVDPTPASASTWDVHARTYGELGR